MKKTTVFAVLNVAFLCGGHAGAADVGALYQQHCSKCHGMDGKGQTTVGKKLKVSDFTDPNWRSKTDASKVRQAIEESVKDSSGNVIMASHKAELTPDEVSALVDYVLKMGAPQ